MECDNILFNSINEDINYVQNLQQINGDVTINSIQTYQYATASNKEMFTTNKITRIFTI